MRIVFILQGRSSSGGVRCISLVGNALQARGHNVRLLYREPEMTLRDRVRVVQHKLRYRNAPNWIRRFTGQVDGFSDLTRCRFDPDEILVAVGMSECAQLGSLDPLPNPKVQYLHGATGWAVENVHTALSLPYPKIVVASYLKDLIEGRGQARDFLGVIHNGVDPREYFPALPESDRDGVGIMYGGQPVEKFDPETIIRVTTRFAALRPEVPLRVFSADRKPARIHSTSYTRYPTVDRARDIYSRSLVWIVASREEGFGLPVLEAMACGCAVVATDCGGPRDVLKDGYNGFLVPVGNVEEIVDRVQLLLDDVALRKQMQLRGLETIKQFTWEKCVDELERALSQMERLHDREPVETRP